MVIANVISVDPDVDLPGSHHFMKNTIVESRKKRILSIAQQSKRHGFAVKFWEGIVATPIYTAINLAHKKIIQFAKDNKLPEVCVMEDDCVLTSPGAWEYFIYNKPKEYDLYLGGVYQAEMKEGRILNGFSGMTLYFVHEKFYDTFLSVPEDYHIDRNLGNIAFKHDYRVCHPFVCIQIGGYSDNLRKQTSYESFYEGKEFYGGRPH
jgi:YHS domain-containing protein